MHHHHHYLVNHHQLGHNEKIINFLVYLWFLVTICMCNHCTKDINIFSPHKQISAKLRQVIFLFIHLLMVILNFEEFQADLWYHQLNDIISVFRPLKLDYWNRKLSILFIKFQLIFATRLLMLLFICQPIKLLKLPIQLIQLLVLFYPTIHKSLIRTYGK